jgi:iron only hydrogenase large subunit-like protein
MNRTFFHAIKLIQENCTGCTKCVRVCPTEALRVRNGKIRLDDRKCIDCGKCVVVCPFDAIHTKADSLSIIHKYKYKLAIISTSYAGQFPSCFGYQNAKKALLKIGFNDVAEESMVTGMMTKVIRDYVAKNSHIRPIISSNCPSVVRLIQVRFPSLLPHIFHVEAPMSVLATYFKGKICKEHQLKEEDVGIFLIVPCISQVTAVHQPEGTYVNLQDGAISIQEVYKEVQKVLKETQDDKQKMEIYPRGLTWSISGLAEDDIQDGKLKTLAVSGIHNIIKMLEKIENRQIEQYDFIVMDSCVNGCIGGVLNIENPYIARSRVKKLVRESAHKDFHDDMFMNMYQDGNFDVRPLEPRSIMSLDKDIKSALEKMKKIKEITAQLPGLDCSACGSPTCAALAEDIASGKAKISDCVVLLRDKTLTAKHKEDK